MAERDVKEGKSKKALSVIYTGIALILSYILYDLVFNTVSAVQTRSAQTVEVYAQRNGLQLHDYWCEFRVDEEGLTKCNIQLKSNQVFIKKCTAGFYQHTIKGERNCFSIGDRYER